MNKLHSHLRLWNTFQQEIESENRTALTDLCAQERCCRLRSFSAAFRTCNMALGFHLPSNVDAPTWPPGVSSWQVRTKIPRRARLSHVASGLTSCHQTSGSGEMMERLNVRVYSNALYAHARTRVCICVRTVNLFPVKSRSPHNKGPGRGES